MACSRRMQCRPKADRLARASVGEVDHAFDGAARFRGDARIDRAPRGACRAGPRRCSRALMRFMCGHRLHGRMNSTSGVSTATLEAIEHSVISATFCGRLVFTQLIIAEVEPVKSAAPRCTSGGHSGCAMICMPGSAARMSAMSCAVKRSCTSQWPFQAMISTLVLVCTYWARYSSGMSRTRGAPRLSTIFTALDEVQQISHSAFTAADVLT